MHVYIARCLIQELHAWGYSSVVEHPAAVRQVLGSTPSVPFDFFSLSFGYFFSPRKKGRGPNRDLNPGPPAPKAGIIPLDHLATADGSRLWNETINLC